MEQGNLIKEELAQALHAHIILLKDIDVVDSTSEEALRFVFRSLGFMLERIPESLISDNEEDLYFAAFQYYNLLAELKSNLILYYPRFSIDLSNFPSDHVGRLNEWWEESTGLKVDEPTKQTMNIEV